MPSLRWRRLRRRNRLHLRTHPKKRKSMRLPLRQNHPPTRNPSRANEKTPRPRQDGFAQSLHLQRKRQTLQRLPRPRQNRKSEIPIPPARQLSRLPHLPNPTNSSNKTQKTRIPKPSKPRLHNKLSTSARQSPIKSSRPSASNRFKTSFPRSAR